MRGSGKKVALCGLLAALDPRDVETLPKVWAPLDDPRNPKSSIAARNNP